MLHWCPIFARTLQTGQTLSWSEKQTTTTINENPNVMHHLIFSLIIESDMYKVPDDLHWMKVLRASLLWYRPIASRENLWTGNLGSGGPAAEEEQYLPIAPVSFQHMEMFYDSASESDKESLKLPIHYYNPRVDCSGENGYLQLRSIRRRSREESPPCIVDEWLSGENWSKRHRQTSAKVWKHRSSRVMEKRGPFPTPSVWTHNGMTEDITRDKSMEVEVAHERPYAIEYLSVHCDIYCHWSSVYPWRQGRFLYADFSKPPK